MKTGEKEQKEEGTKPPACVWDTRNVHRVLEAHDGLVQSEESEEAYRRHFGHRCVMKNFLAAKGARTPRGIKDNSSCCESHAGQGRGAFADTQLARRYNQVTDQRGGSRIFGILPKKE